jgi:ParB family chromosome partitioning protein
MATTNGSKTTEKSAKYETRTLYEIKIDDLQTDPNQPRKYFDEGDLNDLVNSIEKLGVLQPVLFRLDADGKLTVVSGERRYRASKLANRNTIPAIMTDGNAGEIALVENMLREDLTPIEEAEGLQRLKDDENYKGKELAAIIGKSEPTISQILSLNKLPEEIKDEIRNSKNFSRSQLVEVATGKNQKAMMKLFKTLQKKNASRDQLRRDKKQQRDADTILLGMIDSFTEKLKKADLDKMDDEKGKVVKEKLQELSRFITDKVS